MKKLCTVCGKPMISQHASVHDRCKAVVPSYIHRMDSANAALNQLRAGLEAKIKHWTRDMGVKRLVEIFPDMADRVGRPEPIPKIKTHVSFSW